MVSPSTIRFNKLFRITESICDIDNSINYNSVVQKKHDRWKILVDIWASNRRKFGANIFSRPFSYIFAGYPITTKSKKLTSLLEEIKLTLLYDAEALLSWAETDIFFDALSNVNGITTVRAEFSEFQRAQGILRLFYNNQIISRRRNHGNIKLRLPYHYRKSFIECKNICRNFKTKIITLLPSATSWAEEQWCNNDFVCKAINQVHNTNYTELALDLDTILMLFLFRSGGDVCPHELLTERSVSYSMVKAIFSDDADLVVYGLFCQSIELLSEPAFINRYLVNSWLFDIVLEWVNDKKHPYRDKVKKLVFDSIMIA